MQTVTTFDPHKRYILFPIFVTNRNGQRYQFDALLDTGAPATEFSDEALHYAGLLDSPKVDIALQQNLQTQKYGRVTLPSIEICGHLIDELPVYVSHFEKSWGIKALVGLDFFRRFRTTIDFSRSEIISNPY